VKTNIRNLIGLSSIERVTGGVSHHAFLRTSLNDAAGKIKAQGEKREARGERRKERGEKREEQRTLFVGISCFLLSNLVRITRDGAECLHRLPLQYFVTV
jgi:hypothetical protein